MIDLHSHILPCVDDGSRSMKETVYILKKAVSAGFDTICFTPHYAEAEYVKNRKYNEKILSLVKRQAKANNIDVKLLLGNEIFISDEIPKLLENGIISSINNTKYVLIEVPMYQEIPQEIIKKLLCNITNKGYKIIIAHPERYVYIQKNPNKILEYFGDNVIFQSNYASIIGEYGKEAQRTLKKLLKLKVIDYFSSDIHHATVCFYDDIEKILKKLSQMVDKEYFEKLIEINPKIIIQNGEI